MADGDSATESLEDRELEELATRIAGMDDRRQETLLARIRDLRRFKLAAVPRTEDEQRAFALAWNERVTREN